MSTRPGPLQSERFHLLPFDETSGLTGSLEALLAIELDDQEQRGNGLDHT